MPMLIEHIDAIAQKKQHAVLDVIFHPKKSADADPWGSDSHNWQHDPMR